MIRTAEDLAHAVACGLAAAADMDVAVGIVRRVQFGSIIPEQFVIPCVLLAGPSYLVTITKDVGQARPKEEEPAAEDVRNALQLVRSLPGGLAYQAPDLEAIERLLRSAIDKLEPANPPPDQT